MPLKEGARYYGLQLQNIVHHLRKGAWWQACDVAGHNREAERGKSCSPGHFSFSFVLRPHMWSSGTHI